MKDNKGFTLVELLAIIVILGIIAVITTPVILGVIDDARKDAAVDKAWGTIEAIKLAYAQEQNNLKNPGTDTYQNVDITVGTINGKAINDATEPTRIRISGDKPESGSFSITSDGDVVITDFKFGGYKCSNTAAKLNEITCTKKTS